jgi:hypothetical protein
MYRRPIAALLISLMTSACGVHSGPRLTGVGLPAAAGRDAKTARATTEPEMWRQMAQKLPPASVLRIVLADGQRLRGVLLAAEDDALVVKRKTRIPEREARLPYTSIESLELDAPDGIGAGKAVAIGIGTGAATFLGLILVTFALVSD